MRFGSAAAAAVLVSLLVLPAAGVLAAEPSERLEDVNRQLGTAEEGLADVAGRRRVTLDDLQRIDARRQEIDERLLALQAELAQAEASLRAARQRLRDTSAQVVSTRVQLERTQLDLQLLRNQFAGRARTSFMYGGTDAVGVVLDVRDVDELTRGVAYLSNVLAEDDRKVDAMAALEQQVISQVLQLTALQGVQIQQRATAEAERLRIDVLVNEAIALKQEADAQAQHRRALLAQLDADRREYAAVIDRLETESAQLAEQLRAQAAAEARAAAARAETGQPSVSAPTDAGTGGLSWPTNGSVTSEFGNRMHPIYGYERLHAGLDIGAGSGTPIVAAASGTVSIAGSYSGYGNAVAISHGNGLSTLYGHQSSLAVSSGERVSRGQVIGYVGSTGASTGPHLHFEVRVNGSPVDPRGYL